MNTVETRETAAEMPRALTDKEVVASLEKLGWVIENIGPGEAGKFLADEDQKWHEVAKAAKALAQ